MVEGLEVWVAAFPRKRCLGWPPGSIAVQGVSAAGGWGLGLEQWLALLPALGELQHSGQCSPWAVVPVEQQRVLAAAVSSCYSSSLTLILPGWIA